MGPRYSTQARGPGVNVGELKQWIEKFALDDEATVMVECYEYGGDGVYFAELKVVRADLGSNGTNQLNICMPSLP